MLRTFAVHVERAAKFSLLSFVALTILHVASLSAQAQESETIENAMIAPTDSGAYYELNRLPKGLRKSQPFARVFHEFMEHAGTSGTIDKAAYFSTFEEARQNMLNSSRLALKSASAENIISGQWTNIGLSPAGGDSTPSAGITTAIVFDPKSPNIMYAGGSGGGVWKSLDTGANWVPLTDDYLPNLSVASIAVDPVNTYILYVGTGYCYSSTPEYSGSGVYKSTDAGQTWNRLLGGIDSGSFVKLLVDPTKDNIVFASAFDGTTGLFRSTDSGKTWKSVLSHGITFDVIAASAGSNKTTFYAICGNASTNGGVYKSVDDGATWAKVTVDASFYKSSSIGRCALASPLNAPNKILALMTNASGSTSQLYESTDSGVNWNSIPVDTALFVISSFGNYPQGWYDLALAVTPNSISTDTIYVDGVIGEVMRGTGSGWQVFSDYDHSGGGSGYPHVDHHALAISPVNSNIVYDGDDGGLWVNYAAGSNSVQTGGWTLRSHGIISNRFYRFCFDPNDPNSTWAGAQDQGVWNLVNGQSPTHRGQFALGDAMQPLLSATTNSKLAEGPQGLLYRANQTPENWQEIADSVANTAKDNVGWDAPFRMSPVSHGGTPAASILYLGRQHLLQSITGGNKWVQMSPSFAGYDYCTAIGLSSFDANLIYAGGANQVEISSNFGVSWVSRSTGISGEVSSINTSWQDTKFVLISLIGSNNKVMMSDDSGAHWTDVSGVAGSSIPGARVNSICSVHSLAIDSISPLNTWYAGTDWGMYSTIDAGQHWTFMGPGLIPCHDVQLASNGTTLRVASYGRGIWEYSTYTPPSGVELTSLSATKSTNGTALAWYVDGEPAGATFSVERSIGGNSYQSLKSIDGFGASQVRQNYSFSDAMTAPGTYLYRIHEVDLDGSMRYSNSVELHYGADQIYVYQPYPNPFIPSAGSQVTISYELPVRDNAQVSIYNMTGVLIRTLQNGSLDGGPHTVLWDGRDSDGNIVSTGAYIFSVQTGQSGSLQSKVMVVKE